MYKHLVKKNVNRLLFREFRFAIRECTCGRKYKG